MGKYILKRILIMIPTLLVVILIIFVLVNITPGDPARIMLGKEATQEEVDALNHELHMDEPVLVRYFYYVRDALKLDFGTSFRTRQPVFSELMPKVPVTLTLAFWTVAVSVLIGVPLGVFAALKEHSLVDSALTVISLLISAIPGFWLALILIIFFSAKLRLLPSSGIGTPLHYVMPVLAMAVGSSAYYLRLTRTSMQEALRQEYIKTARAKGASKGRVVVVHALRNAMMMVSVNMAANFVSMMGGSMLTETIFGLPGIGSTILMAINTKDIPMIMASTIFVTLILMAGMLAVDILSAMLDPRIRAKYKK